MAERRPPTLRREILLWYSLILLLALGVFTMASYALLDRSLERAEAASLRQTAQAVEQLQVPPQIPRIRTQDELVRLSGQNVEALRRTILLATGDIVEIVVARGEDVEKRALSAFLVIALLLIPLTAGAAALGGRALLDPLLQPLSRLVDATREIGIGRLSRRVDEPERPAELQELARSFNGMLMRLEGAVEALRNFTGDASHELRTPLTSIRGTVQVALSRDRDPEELEETLAEVMEETEWMLHLVDGLLTLARSEEARGLAAPEPVDLSTLLRDVGEVGQALAMDRPLDVRVDAPDDLVVEGSPGQIRQIFLNLVSNAVKFTERGEVALTAAEVEGGRAVEVAVRDTGVGIPPDEIPRVFDRFYRGEAGRAHQGGTGLGLAIARLLVEQHGGRLTVESRIGEGSEFRVVLPREVRPTIAAQQSA